MNVCNLILYLFIFSESYFGFDVSAFTKDAIIGGYYGRQVDFSYLVPILVRQNISNSPALICSGSIITDIFIISVAHCFLQENNLRYLKELSFSVLAGSSDITVRSLGIEILVDLMYMPSHHVDISFNDIAVLQLKHSLNHCEGCTLSKVELPSSAEPISETFAIVSGYGYSWIKTEFDPNEQILVRTGGGSTYLLKYAFVRIVNNQRCQMTYPDLNLNQQFCGVIVVEKEGQQWGNCALDSGNPLISHNRLVGIASRGTPMCDDTIQGCIYTRISVYVDFIKTVIEKLPNKNNMHIYQNPSHIYNQEDTLAIDHFEYN